MTPWKLATAVLGGCLVASSLASGAASALVAGYGLHRFGAINYVPALLALEIPRVSAPRLAVLSACLAAVAWAHRREAADGWGRWRSGLWTPFALVPVWTVLATALAIFGGLGVMVTVFGVSAESFREVLLRTAIPEDLGHGLARGGVFAVVLGAASVAAGPLLSRGPRDRWPLWTKLAITWVVARVLLAALEVGVDAAWPNPRTDLLPP